MPIIRRLFECVTLALVEKGRAALSGASTFAEALPDIALATHIHASESLSSNDLRRAFQKAVTATPEVVRDQARLIVAEMPALQGSQLRPQIQSYLELIPYSISRALRRPPDPDGELVPDKFQIDTPEQWLLYLPPRLQQLQLGEVVPGVDNWELNQLVGMGRGTEVWQGWDDMLPEMSPTLLKFIVDPSLQQALLNRLDIFEFLLSLEPFTGMVPIRGVYYEASPPCIEMEFVPGYDLGGMMRDWAWRYDRARPDYAIRLIRRLAEILGGMHRHDPPIIHRDLKPTNVLIHPTAEGRFTVWLSDLGWGQISAEHTLKLISKTPRRGDLLRQSARGGNTLLYASPQTLNGDPPDPRDDVYSLGMIWYQLLRRNPAAPPPIGNDWGQDFRAMGVPDAQTRLLAACLSAKASSRPADGASLLEKITALAAVEAEPPSGPQSFVLKGSATYKPLIPVASARSTTDSPKSDHDIRSLAGTNGLPNMLRNSVGMNLVLIPAGSYEMGSPENEPGRHPNEGPVHVVTITQPFYLSMTPVTQAQYEQVMGKNPSHFNRWHSGGPDHPVEQVKWEEALTFCARLTSRPEERELGFVYRLPTEAEWEYACRGGTTTPFAFGHSLNGQQARFLGSDVSQIHRLGGGGRTLPVGSFMSNPYGLLDMHGNVAEWCADWFADEYYIESPEVDPPGPRHGALKVIRGGSWSQFPGECRSAARMGHAPDKPVNTIGFRVVLTLPDPARIGG